MGQYAFDQYQGRLYRVFEGTVLEGVVTNHIDGGLAGPILIMLTVGSERLTLEAGEYAVVHVNDTALLRDTWAWLLGHWLATSGRREKNAPEFERFTSISEAGTPIGPVEIWIPLEPLSQD